MAPNQIDAAAVRPLTKREIDDRIKQVIEDVAAPDVLAAADAAVDEDGWRPRWIDAGELVRRMRRFIVYN